MEPSFSLSFNLSDKSSVFTAGGASVNQEREVTLMKAERAFRFIFINTPHHDDNSIFLMI